MTFWSIEVADIAIIIILTIDILKGLLVINFRIPSVTFSRPESFPLFESYLPNQSPSPPNSVLVLLEESTAVNTFPDSDLRGNQVDKSHSFILS